LHRVQNKTFGFMFFVFGIALLICICLLSCKIYVSYVKKVSFPHTNLQNVSELNMVSHSEDPMFFVSVQSGVVKVQSCHDENIGFLLNNIDIRTMRNVDKYRFESGFYLYSEEELSKLLEDYGS